MVCKPKKWKKLIEKPKTLDDISGGYLSEPVNNLYQPRYRILSTRDNEHFNIKLERDYDDLCKSINTLQSQSFRIQKSFFNTIDKTYHGLVHIGLLMPKYLAKINVSQAIVMLRNVYFENKHIWNVFTYQELLHEFMIKIQQARYEDFILEMANAYKHFEFDLPAFHSLTSVVGSTVLVGVFHFHERDLSRSLILFNRAPLNRKSNLLDINRVIGIAAAFHYKKFNSYNEALQWIDRNIFKEKNDIDQLEKIFLLAINASSPFQFISKCLCLIYDDIDCKYDMPITQDASASAYQIMSWFLQDKNIGINTNLIPYYPEKGISKYEKSELLEMKDIYIYIGNDFYQNLSAHSAIR